MVGVPWLMSIGLALVTRMGGEEAMMVEQFGESYERLQGTYGAVLDVSRPAAPKGFRIDPHDSRLG